MSKLPKKLLLFIICAGGIFLTDVFTAGAQTTEAAPPMRRLTMKQTIRMAQEQSISSMVSQNIFASEYWRYRSYRAERLPSLNLQAGVLGLDRSIVPLQDATTGAINYRPVFTLSNDVSLFLQQKISATGGTLQLRSSLRRLDQFNLDNLTWYSQPITLSYMQPLFGYNAMKWEKRIRPHDYEAAKLEYLENMENVTILAASYFWNLAMAELNCDNAERNYENSKRLYRISQERYKIGAISRSEVLQLELRALQDSLAINTSKIDYAEQKNYLVSFVGLREDADIELEVDYDLPGITLDYQEVLATALKNSSFELNRTIELLESERAIAQAKANRGIDVSFNARFGLSQSGESVSRAYSHLRDQQVAGFSIGIPILDWGMGLGRVKMAQSEAERIRYQQEQARLDYERDIIVGVMEFNAQQAQCEGALRAKNIADERFALSIDNFERGTITVLELNTAQNEKDAADRNYISSLGNYWNYYFTLRKTTLYDFLSRTDIGAAFGDAEYEALLK